MLFTDPPCFSMLITEFQSCSILFQWFSIAQILSIHAHGFAIFFSGFQWFAMLSMFDAMPFDKFQRCSILFNTFHCYSMRFMLFGVFNAFSMIVQCFRLFSYYLQRDSIVSNTLSLLINGFQYCSMLLNDVQMNVLNAQSVQRFSIL